MTKKELRMVPNVLCLIRLASMPYLCFILFGGLRADYTYFVLIGLGVFLFLEVRICLTVISPEKYMVPNLANSFGNSPTK